MITVSPEKDRAVIKNLFEENEIACGEFSGAVIAKCDDEILGYCLYDLEAKKITVHSVEPQNDVMLADGILRSALHVAAERSIMDAYYSEKAPEAIFEMLGFVKDKQNKAIDIDKLFGGCGCKKEN